MTALATVEFERQLAEHLPVLTAHCRRVLGSGFEADDAAQETLVRAWRARHRFEGRSPLLAWLRRIATNVCLDMSTAPQRRATPADPTTGPLARQVAGAAGATGAAGPVDDPAEHAVGRDEVRLALVAALVHLPPRQRSVLLLCGVLSWRAAEAAELLDTSVAAVNSLLQRARAALGERHGQEPGAGGERDLDDHQRALLRRYADAFERHDLTALTALLRSPPLPADEPRPRRGRPAHRAPIDDPTTPDRDDDHQERLP
jgi:RNA polymerase sigma-70 factor (ECF subfamily)